MNKDHRINKSAIVMGMLAFVDHKALGAEIAPPLPPTSQHPVLWVDDWWRGVEMAAECARRTFEAVPPEDQLPPESHVAVFQVVHQEYTLGPSTLPEDATADMFLALERLTIFLNNLAERGDPDVSATSDGEELDEACEPA